MPLTRNFKYLIILTIISVGLLRFINIGAFNLQEWDESLYGVRAKSVLSWNEWLDQTEHSAGGLYSATHPPLYIWLTALSYYLFGISEFSTRLISALAGTGILIITFLLCKRFFNSRTGLLSVLLLGLNPFFSFWSRQGQFDILLVFFITLSFFFYVCNYTPVDKDIPQKKKYIFDILCGIAIGLALMSKLFVGIFVIISIIAFNLIYLKRFNFKQLLLISFFALSIFLPWHIFMIFKHGNGDFLFFFKQSALLERTFSGIEGNTKELGFFFYINQIIIYFPYIAIFTLYGFYKLIFTEIRTKKILFLWFLIYFFIITLISTKLSVYILPVCVPLIIIASKIVNDLFEKKLPGNISYYLLSGMLFCVFWAYNSTLRNDFKKIFSSDFLTQLKYFLSEYYWIIFLLIFLEIIIYFTFKKNYFKLPGYETILFISVTPLFILSLYHFIIIEPVKYNDGIKEIAEYVRQNPPEQIYSIGNGMNPQISFYMDGIDIGWNSNIKFIRLEPYKGLSAIFNRLDTLDKDKVYILVEKEEMLLGSFTDYSQIIPGKYKNLLETKGYSLFKP